MSRSDELRLGDILEAARLIEQLSLRGYVAFDDDPALKLAMERLLEIIGEAAGSLSEDFRARHAAVAWTDIRRLRIVLAHHYHRVDPEQVWTIATVDIPRMVAYLSDPED